MRTSFSAVSQIVARKMREDPAYRAEMESSGRPVLETARERSSEELARILTPYTGPLDPETFRRLCWQFPSAEEMTCSLLQDRDSLEASEEDWVWLALTVLWERWAPDVPSLESVDERMQLGYDEGVGGPSCEVWLSVWRDVLHLMDELDMKSLDAFDERFGATQSLFNWVQDLEMELGNAMVEDERFIAERIRFCREFLDRFPQEDPKIVGNMRSALAGSHIVAGRTETGDRLYREWLEADPAWGWGWIGWSDAYGPFAWGTHDFARAEEILRRGLAVPDLRDRKDVLERLADLYGEMGREEEESRVRRELRQLSGPRERLSVEGVPPHGLRIRREIDFGAEGPPLEQLTELRTPLAPRPAPASRAKVGRNQPCPCGSGKKYKKCCGRSEATP